MTEMKKTTKMPSDDQLTIRVNLEDITDDMAALYDLTNLMHYDPEAIPDSQAENVEKLQQALQYAVRLAREISKKCEY